MGKQLFMRYPGGRAKALTLSYDDGVSSDRRLIEILNRYGLKCTFNLNSGLYLAEEKAVEVADGSFRRLSEREAAELYAGSGHEVAVHGLTHPFLEKMQPSEMVYEVMQDRINLERRFGRIVRGMAYPYGTYSDEVVECLKKCGIVYARTTVSTKQFSVPSDWLRMPATCHHKDADLMKLTDRFSEMQVRFSPQLFYLWGHTFEFVRDNNWNVIEDFAEKMGNREDIWYATNIEIYEYVQDYQRLVRSADGKQIYNPTGRTLYLENDEAKITVAAGETVAVESGNM